MERISSAKGRGIRWRPHGSLTRRDSPSEEEEDVTSAGASSNSNSCGKSATICGWPVLPLHILAMPIFPL